IRDDEPPAVGLDEGENREPDRPGTDHQNVLAALYLRSRDGVAADAECLDQRELLEREFGRGVKLVSGNHEELLHSAVAVHAEDLELDAAVALSPPAGDAAAAVEVRLDGAAVADFQPRRGVVHRDDLDAQFVAEDARVGEERLAAA